VVVSVPKPGFTDAAVVEQTGYIVNLVISTEIRDMSKMLMN